MKCLVVLLSIVTLFTSILAPFSVDARSADGDIPRLLELKVCHDGSPLLTGSAEFPYLLHSDIIIPAPSETGKLKIYPQRYSDLLIIFEEEKPPKV